MYVIASYRIFQMSIIMIKHNGRREMVDHTILPHPK
jgi:hypothetical protein